MENVLQQMTKFFKMDAEVFKVREARLPLHIMVVEDDPVAQRLITSIFAKNYIVSVYSDAEEAMQEYIKILPDLVFLDIDLGSKEYTGMDILKAVTGCDKKANIVMVSANNSQENIDIAYSLGAKGFLAKPFNPSNLKRYVQDMELIRARKEAGTWS